jgi:putative ABC transport system substrate-binding protein
MRRRDFISLLGGAATAWPLPLRAQQSKGRPTIGMLIPGSPDTYRQRVASFVKRLSELGWVDGQTAKIEYRWAEAQRFDDIAAEFVQLKVDVIFTSGTPPTVVAQRATSDIPIVFAPAGDPVGAGLVKSLARPGGNVTGVSNQTVDTAGKRLGLLREMLPGLHRIAVMSKAENASAAIEMRQAEEAAAAMGLQFVPIQIREASDIQAAFSGLSGRADALYVVIDSLVTTQQSQLNNLALQARLPTIHGARELVTSGGLMSYGAEYLEMWRRAGDFVDKILRGAKPAELPVEQPTKFNLIINLATAKALGIDVPLSLLGRADEVIE